MKTLLLLFLASIPSLEFFEKNHTGNSVYFKNRVPDIKSYKTQTAVGCRPNLAAIDFKKSSNQIPLLEGWGKYRMPVTTSNDSANIYFQQGINMYYGFHIIEATASFEKAVTFDPNFAMGHWGKALALGPNINDIGYNTSADALKAIENAKSLYSNCTGVEKALIEAMKQRYSLDSLQSREHLNQVYADAMKKVHDNFPKSADAAALYADALMVQHPWDLYDRFYNPKSWTPEIVQVLEKLVKQFPENPGASHYYIHAIEGSKTPERGLEVADRLGGLMPGLAHLVHMPSHIYIRSGQYEKGIASNDLAVKDYYNYLSKYPLTAGGSFIYLVHNQHMQAVCAGMDGQYKNAFKFSQETQKSVDPGWLDEGAYFGVYAQYMYMVPYFTQIRFGKWDDILTAPEITPSRVYANMMWHFARGTAYARKHQFEQANLELKKLQDSKPNSQLRESPAAFNPGITAAQVAEKILQGVIAEENNQVDKAVELFNQAVDMEDGMLYNEPKDWILPARHFLGHVLLNAKDYSKAEKVYKEDLTVNPNNAWSLTGLEKALVKQNKKAEAKTVNQQLRKALARADVQIPGSVY
ncbi:MAG: tetratricopeptide repeat protein [Flavitalea sp.]